MAASLDQQFGDVASITGAVRRRESAVTEIVRLSLERAEQGEPQLGAFTAVLSEYALARARRLDRDLARGAELGPLAGVPVSVKDAIWIADVPATHGSRACAGFVPSQSSASVCRLEDAGAVVIGKTNNPEFCFFGYTDGPLLGPARNPWNRELTAGGSSGGAGASVAAGVTPLALGSDGGGSIRGPASFCGVFGLKPSFGLVPCQPSFRVWPSLSVDGPIARSATDAAAALAALAGRDPRDETTLGSSARDYVAAVARPEETLDGARVAWSTDLGYASVDPKVRGVFREAIADLERAGVKLTEDHPDAGDPTRTWTAVAVCEGFAALGHLLRDWEAEMWPGVPEIIRAGNRPAVDYLRSLEERSRFSRGWAEFFDRYDILLTPMMQVPPFAIGSTGPSEIDGRPVDPFFDDWSNLCYPANLTGQPAASVPIGFTEGPLPVGMQVLAPHFRDDLALAFGRLIESLRPQPFPAESSASAVHSLSPERPSVAR